MDWELLLVLLCMVFSGTFSAAETALTSLGRLEVQKIVAGGSSPARLIQTWVRDPGRILITILVGNNIANFAGSSVFALWAARNIPNYLSASVVAISMTFIIFSEIVPKLFARRLALDMAPFAMRFLIAVHFVLSPLIWIVQKISSGVVLLSGMPGREVRAPLSEEDLTHTIEIATKDGGIDRATGEVLSNLIDFPDRLARHVMTPRSHMSAISIAWSWDRVLQYIAQDGHSRYPVYRSDLDDIVGVILVKDLLREFQKQSPGSWTRRIRRPYYVSEVAPLGNLLRDMKRWGTHLALVRNEIGVTTGLVTLEDLIEEIVGDIRDEHDDPSEAGLESALGGPRLVNGEMSIVDFNHRFNTTLPVEPSYSTLNGYLLTRTGGQLPPPGTLIIDENVTFRIHSISDAGIVTVELLDYAQSTET